MAALSQYLGAHMSCTQRWIAWQGLLLACGLWTWWWSQRRPSPGTARLVIALPVLTLNLLMPFAFDGDAEVLSNISVFLSASVTNFKLLSWVMDRGSLTCPLTRAQFLAVYAWPISPAKIGDGVSEADGEKDTQAKSRRGKGRLAEVRTAGKHFRHFLRKAVVLVGVAHLLVSYRLPRIPRILLQGLSQYLFLSMSMDALAALVSATTGLSVSPHFDNPYLATSVADFWNHRWNLTVSNVLRSCVYDPWMEGRLVRRPGQAAPFSRTRRLVGVLLVFLVSGLMHEAMFWSFAGCFSPRLMWLTYFVLWGVLLVAESVLKKAVKRSSLKMPAIISRILTVAIVNAMVAALWWPPVDQLGIPQKATQHAVGGLRTLQAAALGRWQV